MDRVKTDRHIEPISGSVGGVTWIEPDRVGHPEEHRVYLDGELAQSAHGSDVDPDGRGILTSQRTYQLIRQPGKVAERRFEIEFLDAGVEAYCFTFG